MKFTLQEEHHPGEYRPQLLRPAKLALGDQTIIPSRANPTTAIIILLVMALVAVILVQAGSRVVIAATNPITNLGLART